METSLTHVIATMKNQALWLNKAVTQGSHVPQRSAPRLLISASVPSGTATMLAAVETGLNR